MSNFIFPRLINRIHNLQYMKKLKYRSSFKFIIYFFIPVLLAKPFFATGQIFSDYHKIDSVLYQLKKSKPDSNRVRMFNELSADYLSKKELSPAEFDKVLKYLRYAIGLCDSLGLPFMRWKAKSLYLEGRTLILYNRVAEGKAVFLGLIKNAHDAGDRKREAEAWRNYALILLDANKMGTSEHDAETAFINAANIFREIKDQKGYIDVNLELGLWRSRIADLHNVENELLPLIKVCEAFGTYKLSNVYYLLSVISRYLGNYNKALGYAFHAVKSMEKRKDSTDADIYYGELAEVYEALNQPAESVTWYKKCIDKRELIAGYPPFALYRTYSLLVIQLIKSGAQKEALATIKALQKRRPPGTLSESAILSQSLAYCYDAYNAYDSTEKYFLKTIATYNQSYKILHMVDEIISMARFDIADFYVRYHQFMKARPYLDTLLLQPNSINVSKKTKMQLLLFKVDSASGNYITAIKHLQQYKTLTDSIFNENKSRQIEQLQVEYKTEKKDQEIRLLTKKDQLQQANLRQANIIRNWITASTALLILLLAVGYNRYRFKQKANRKLEEQQIVINQKNISLQRLVNEKEWLMKEIHHRVKNNFHIVMGLLGTQSGYLRNEEAIAAIKESQQRIHAMSLIHQKLYQSENLSAIDMPGYIHELADYLQESFDKGAATRFHFQVDRIQLALSHVIPVGLILNEAITNVFKHAFPNKKEGNIYISFTQAPDDNRIVLTVRDDGAGLPAGFNSNSQSSMGLNLMKGLSADIDGRFIIESNNGTIVTVNFIYNPDLSQDFVPSAGSQNFSV